MASHELVVLRCSKALTFSLVKTNLLIFGRCFAFMDSKVDRQFVKSSKIEKNNQFFSPAKHHDGYGCVSMWKISTLFGCFIGGKT